MFKGEEHGISKDLLASDIADLNPILICPVCNLIIRNPMECTHKSCHATLCSPCLNKLLLEDETCPECKNTAKFEPNHFMLSRYLSKLKFKCINFPTCKTIFQYSELESHICEHKMVECKVQGCNWKGKMLRLESHEIACEWTADVCPNISQGCTWTGKKWSIKQHLQQCEWEEIYCSQGCGIKVFRKNMGDHHYNLCENRKVACVYAERGCKDHPQKLVAAQHTDYCPYKPVILECNHTVSMKDRQEHKEYCAAYPLRCGECSSILTRKEMKNHDCINFLHHRIFELLNENVTNKETLKMQESLIEGLTLDIEKEKKNKIEQKDLLFKEMINDQGITKNMRDIQQLLDSKVDSVRRGGKQVKQLVKDTLVEEIPLKNPEEEKRRPTKHSSTTLMQQLTTKNEYNFA